MFDLPLLASCSVWLRFRSGLRQPQPPVYLVRQPAQTALPHAASMPRVALRRDRARFPAAAPVEDGTHLTGGRGKQGITVAREVDHTGAAVLTCIRAKRSRSGG